MNNGERNHGAAIELIGLTKRYGDQIAVDDLSLRIEPGVTFGLIGPNGAGKSTTIKMLMGLTSISSGSARVMGLDVAADPLGVKQAVGYVPELPTMYRWMRIDEVIGFCKALRPTWNDRVCSQMLAMFELDPHKKVKHLSKGMTTKLSLVLSIAHEPSVLILDEPTSGLDPIVREEFLDGVLETICQRRCTVLFSSHTLSDVQRLADTVGIIYGGRLLVCRPTDALLTGTKRIRAVLRDGCEPAEPPAGLVWQQVHRREWLVTVSDYSPTTLQQLRATNPVDHVEVMDLGLEELFKDYVRGWRKPA